MSERDLNQLIATIEKQLGVAWTEVVEWLRQQNGLDELERRLANGDWNEIVTDVQEAALKFAADTHRSYLTAGQSTAEWLNAKLPDSLVRFDTQNHLAVARATADQREQVAGLTAEQRQTVNQVLVDGTRRGVNPREMARDIRDSIGLAPNQEAAIRSYRRALEAGDYSNALGRELSNGHSDRVIRGVQSSQGQLTQEQIDVAVERYRKNFIAYRAEVIARSEALRSVHQGNDDAFAQAVARGDVSADQLEGEWVPGPRTKDARPDHRDPSLLSQRPKYGQPFVMPDGTRMRFPGDPAGGVKNCACCRCTKATRLVA